MRWDFPTLMRPHIRRMDQDQLLRDWQNNDPMCRQFFQIEQNIIGDMCREIVGTSYFARIRSRFKEKYYGLVYGHPSASQDYIEKRLKFVSDFDLGNLYVLGKQQAMSSDKQYQEGYYELIKIRSILDHNRSADLSTYLERKYMDYLRKHSADSQNLIELRKLLDDAASKITTIILDRLKMHQQQVGFAAQVPTYGKNDADHKDTAPTEPTVSEENPNPVRLNQNEGEWDAPVLQNRQGLN